MKPHRQNPKRGHNQSPPTRGRELKPLQDLEDLGMLVSPPTRGRELKPVNKSIAVERGRRPPRGGVN